MNVVFAHDHKFILGQDGLVYSTGSFPKSMWERYLHFFEKVIVVSRREEGVVETKNLTLSSHDNVEFVFLPNILSPLNLHEKRIAYQIITEKLLDAHALIARLPSEIGSLATRAALRLNLPYAVEVVGCGFDSMWTYGTLKGRLYAPILFWKTKKAVQKADSAIYVTQSFLQKRYPNPNFSSYASNVELIPSSIEAQINLRRSNFSTWKHKTIKIGLIGHLYADYKGLDVALKALHIIKLSDFHRFKFEVVGKGEKKKWAQLSEKLGIKENINFLGALSGGSAINSWLDTVDIYLQPSRTEGLPRALIEAMNRGCLCTASNVGGIPELLHKNLLHFPKDYIQLSKNICYFLNLKEKEYKDLVKENLSKARNYSPVVLKKRRNEFWEKFTNNLVDA